MPEYVAVKIMPDKKGTSYNLEVVTDADFVNVVRCKDCKHWQNKHVCSAWSRFGTIETKGDQFCCYGEKVTE